MTLNLGFSVSFIRGILTEARRGPMKTYLERKQNFAEDMVHGENDAPLVQCNIG